MSYKPFHDPLGIVRGTAKCVSTHTCHKRKQPYTAQLLGLETITRLPLNMFASIIKSFFLKKKLNLSHLSVKGTSKYRKCIT